ncbi:hypothetical protein F5Y13DRAFT_196165 [Hypoxylon sp. FL1857]|nr:hypothetical protein F5Y13DRAFT_196165 [Hypoxylon sp. FL1857]
MGNPQADTPQGKASGKLSEDAVMDAMMLDLGNSRLEELAMDEDGGRSRGRRNFQAERRPALTQQREGGPINPGAAKWNKAFEEGVFDDDDARAVKDLDSLDDGNAHRRNRAPVVPMNGDHNNRQTQNFQTREVFNPISSRIRQYSHYNPANPGYTKSKSRPSPRVPDQGSMETSLGGVVPRGVEVRRWDSRGPSHLAVTANTPGIGRGAGRGAPISSGLQQARPELGGRGRGAPQRMQQPSPGLSRPGHSHVSATAQKAPRGKNNSATKTPASKHTTARPPTTGPSTAQPKVVNSTATSIPPVVVSQHKSGEASGRRTGTSGRVSKQVSNGTQIAGNDTVDRLNQSDGSTHPAHRRMTSYQKAELVAATSTQQAQTSGDVQKQSTAPSEFGKVIFREEVNAMLEVGIDKITPGQVLFYEPSQGAAVIWEIRTTDGRVLRGDIRSCLPPFPFGYNVHLRRQDGYGKVRSTQIQFRDIKTANMFGEFLDHHRNQPYDPAKPKLEETLVGESRKVQPPGHSQVDSGDNVSGWGKATGQDIQNQALSTSRAKANISEAPKIVSMATTSPQPFRNERASPEKLIDFNSPDSPEGTQARPSDLEGLHYQVAATQPLDSPIAQTKLQESISVKDNEYSSLGGFDRTDPLSQSEAPSQSDDAQEKRRLAIKATVLALSDLDAIEAIPLGHNMSQNSLRILSALRGQDYERMIEECRAIVQYLELREASRGVPWLKPTALQIAANQLMRYDDFETLKWDEQKKVCAVVYANVLHGDSRVIRSVGEMMDLRSSARPCPDSVRHSSHAMPSAPQASARTPFTVPKDREIQRQQEAEEERREEERRTTGEQLLIGEEQRHVEGDKNNTNASGFLTHFKEMFMGQVDGSGESTDFSEKTNGQAPVTVSSGPTGQSLLPQLPRRRGLDDSIHAPQQGLGRRAPAPLAPSSYGTTGSLTTTPAATRTLPHLSQGSGLGASN